MRYPFLAAALTCASIAVAQQISLTPLTTGASTKLGFFIPHLLALSAKSPAGLVKAPAGLESPSYAILKLQGKSFIAIVDRPAKGDPKLYVDPDGSGDFSKDQPASWKATPYEVPGHSTPLKAFKGTFSLNLSLNGKSTALSFGAYIFDKNDPVRPDSVKNSLLWFPDYVEQGTLAVNGKNYAFILLDNSSSGGFAFKEAPASPSGAPSVILVIDRKGDGAFGKTQQNVYDAAQPFNIGGGISYQISQIAADGSSLQLDKAAKPVDEVPLSLGAGDPARVFTAKTTTGQSVNFPSDYKHHVVLLDFWATWCGPCMAEAPNVVAAYNKYHDQGFDILGISLDNEQSAANLPKVTKDKGMVWPMVCDHKFWQAAVAVLYGIDSIPHAFLVDGDSGVVIAEGDSIRGDALGEAVNAALIAKKKAAAKPTPAPTPSQPSAPATTPPANPPAAPTPAPSTGP
jgi:peroxiredoxin